MLEASKPYLFLSLESASTEEFQAEVEMSAASTVTVAAPGMGLRPPFTVEQWQELEHQALIYKYLVAGLSVPPDLLVPIQRSFESISARFFHQSSLGYCSYFGKKIDPEPGRCRRTDGKKWRCSRDAYPDSKYCERHMNRGRNRSRKPVESQSTSQTLSTAMSRNATGSNGGTASFQSLPSHSVVSDQASLLGNNAAKWQMEPASYVINNKDLRYLQGVKSGADEQGLHPEGSGSAHVLSMDRSSDNIWHRTPSSVRVNQSGSSSYGDNLQSNACQPHMLQNFESTSNQAMNKRQQHCFFGSKIGSPGSVEQESNTLRTPFGEWPRGGDSWTNLGDQGYDRSAFSTTELSISVPISLSEMSSRNACSPHGD